MSHGVALSLFVRLTFPEVPRKMCAQLCAASVTLTFGRTIWPWLKISWTPITSVVMGGFISRMITGMIFGTNRVINNSCANFLLVVWVSSFGLLHRSLFGSLPVTTNFSESLIASTRLSESFIWSTCSAEFFPREVLASTCSSESFILSTCLSELLCA